MFFFAKKTKCLTEIPDQVDANKELYPSCCEGRNTVRDPFVAVKIRHQLPREEVRITSYTLVKISKIYKKNLSENSRGLILAEQK